MKNHDEPEILFLDNHLLVMCKPAGWLSQADETGDLDVLQWGKAYLKRRFEKPGRVFLGLVHRLDRPASGVMVMARTSKAAARLTKAFKDRLVDKQYLVVVQGRVEGEGEYRDFIAKKGRYPGVVPAGDVAGKLAHLGYEALHSRGEETLVRVWLRTGRPHQIRLQFSSRGLPVVGDARYGTPIPAPGHLMLHCCRVGLPHPVGQRHLVWSCPPPHTWGPWREKALELPFWKA